MKSMFPVRDNDSTTYGVIKICCFVVLVVLLCASAAKSPLNKETEAVLLSQLANPLTGEIDDDKAQLLWISCDKLDLIKLKEDDELVKFLSNESIQRIIDATHPQMKETLLDCLQKKNLLLVSREDDSKTQHENYPRRLLGEKKTKNTRTSIISATTVTASVTFVIVAVVFLCFKTGSRVRKTGQTPLPSFSVTNFSSVKNEKLGHQTRVNINQYERASTLESDEDVEPDVLHSRKPPPLGAAGDTSKSSAAAAPSDASSIDAVRVNPPHEGMAAATSTSPPPPPTAPPPTLKPTSNIGGAPPLLPPIPVKKVGPRPPGPPPPPTNIGGAAPPPPPMPGKNVGPHPPGPPPPPMTGLPPPRPPSAAPRPSPHVPKHTLKSTTEDDAPKSKTKPFFWEKVAANRDHSMVWDRVGLGSFQVDEEKLESRFGFILPVNSTNKESKKESTSQDPPPQYIHIIDSKKSQNLSIMLRALNVTKEEVCDALHEGNELPFELIQNILKMAPTTEEEQKLRLFSGDISQLGPAERFLKALVDIPFAFKRLEVLLFMCTFQEDVTLTRESFSTLELACEELKNSRLFLKLLEAVLKTGNRMNDGTFRGRAQAFKLDTLLKLSDVKGADGKTTLLHFVVQQIIRPEGVRASSQAAKGSHGDAEGYYRKLGLETVLGLSSELENVKKAAALDADSLTGTVAKLNSELLNSQKFLITDMKSTGEDDAFLKTLKNFVQNAEVDITSLVEEEKRITILVKSTGDYFHGNTAGKNEGLQLFIIVRDFLIILDKACSEVKDELRNPRITGAEKAASGSDINQTTPTGSTSSDINQSPFINLHQRLFPAIKDRRIDYDSSSDEKSP